MDPMTQATQKKTAATSQQDATTERNNSRKKWLVAIATTILALAAVEIVSRVQFSMHRKSRGFALDQELGWTIVPNTKLSTNQRGYGDVTFSTHEHGFRRYGDVKSTKRKVLVIGDSYTFADTVNDGEAYYDRLAEKLDAEVFAFGCNGYSTLQELIILKRHFESIDPDLVIWQLCDNDFVNNSLDLESKDLLQSNMMVRPYRMGGENVLSFPATTGASLLANSQLARWCYRQFYARGRKQFDYSKSENKLLAEQGVWLTVSLMKEAKSHIEPIPMLVFCNNNGGLYLKALQGFDGYVTVAVEQAIEAAAKQGTTVDARPHDRHWNAAGQEIVAETLKQIIGEQHLL